VLPLLRSAIVISSFEAKPARPGSRDYVVLRGGLPWARLLASDPPDAADLLLDDGRRLTARPVPYRGGVLAAVLGRLLRRREWVLASDGTALATAVQPGEIRPTFELTFEDGARYLLRPARRAFELSRDGSAVGRIERRGRLSRGAVATLPPGLPPEHLLLPLFLVTRAWETLVEAA
jgi:hypothetical protein